jgi:hypothetical protein
MSQARVGRIVGLSLGGLWLAISMLAAIAMDAPETQMVASASTSAPFAEIMRAAEIIPASN